MKYKIGDKIRVKSLEWYNKNKNEFGTVKCNGAYFQPPMSKFCGNIFTIKKIDKDIKAYIVEENHYYWDDYMFEGLVEEKEIYKDTPNKICRIFISDEDYQDKVELCLGDDYEIVIKNGKTFVQKKKPKYPTTYEECCEVIGISRHDVEIDLPHPYQQKMFNLFKLLICRDAYWKIAGEQMGLGKSWEPIWDYNQPDKYILINVRNSIHKDFRCLESAILAFPTEEMRDDFYENFKDLIEQVIELL